MVLSREFLKSKFPNLIDFEIYINTESPHYNCISHSIGRNDIWSWPKIVDKSNYWPANDISESKYSFDEFYLYHGFKPIEFEIRDNGNYKIALYGVNNIPKHAALQLDEDFWESKIGGGEIIKHDLFELEGGIYGDVIQIYQNSVNK